MLWNTEPLGRAKPPSESCHETEKVGQRERSWRCRRGPTEAPRQAADGTCAANAVRLRKPIGVGRAERSEAECETWRAKRGKGTKTEARNTA